MLTCPVCNYTSTAFEKKIAKCLVPKRFKGERLIRHICPKCDLIFGTQEVLNMSKEEAAYFNETRYTRVDIEKREQTNLSRLPILSDIGVTPGDSVLNWGSGPADALAKAAREQYGVQFDNFDPYLHDGFDETIFDIISDYSKLSTYDWIISTSVIEHFVDPIGEFEKMKKVLKKHGKMAHRTPCYDYAFEGSKMHTAFFLGRSVQMLADKIGMKVRFLDPITAIFENEETDESSIDGSAPLGEDNTN